MRPGTYNISIVQGATFDQIFTWKDSFGVPTNLTGFTARMQVRSEVGAAGAPLLELTTDNGGIVLGGTAGTIRIIVTATLSAALNYDFGVYDLELVSAAGVVTRLLEGSAALSPEVTK